jgi:hypothetical protein
MMLEKIFAGLVLVACVALLLRQALREPQRQRVDAVARHAAFTTRRLARHLWYWRRHRKRAAREAEEAIRRAQRNGSSEGNVIRPDAFKGPRKPH